MVVHMEQNKMITQEQDKSASCAVWGEIGWDSFLSGI